MYSELRSIIARHNATLITDAFGALSLMTALIVGLHLPGLF
ncbi:hypothetical protein [Tropicimonas sp. IMCC34043]|nr:hypothetical protein [Tropicimonas sp. IMCC34043]